MNVATLFASEDTLPVLFEDFIYSYAKVRFDGKDSDTAFFNDSMTGIRQLYFHYILNDVGYEFSYNYSANDVVDIRKHFEGERLFSFDLSFSSEEFLKTLLSDFSIYLKNRNEVRLIDKILISHPYKGLLNLEYESIKN